MGNEKTEVYEKIMVWLLPADYQALEKEAKEKGVTLAAHVRDILQLYVMRENLEENIEKKFMEILTSDKLNDEFLEKFNRATSKNPRR